MPEELSFKDEAAAEYDRAFAHVTMHFMPFLLRAAHVAPGMRVLDVATDTGLSAEAALPPSARPATSRLRTSRLPWSGRRASASAKRPMFLSRSRTGRRFHSPMRVSTRYYAISD